MKRINFNVARVTFAAFIFLCMAGFSYWELRQYTQMGQDLAERREIVVVADELLADVLGAETAQRGFLLSGDDAYLAPYEEALLMIPGRFGDLERMAAGRPETSADVQRLKEVVKLRLEEMARTIALRREAGLTPALDAMMTGEGREIMEEIRAIVAAFHFRQSDAQEEVAFVQETTARIALLATFSVSILLLFFLASSFDPVVRSGYTRKPRSLIVVYGATVLGVGGAFLLRLALTPLIGPTAIPFLTFLPVTLFSSWAGGFRPGALSVLLSALGASYFMEPVGQLKIAAFGDQIALLLNFMVGLGISFLGHTQGNALARAEYEANQREEAERAERNQRLLAETANRTKDEFLAMVSHELRTPLHAILGWTEILGANPEPEKARRALEAVTRNVRLQSRIIEDLLDVSSIITGKLRLELQSVILENVVEAAFDTLRPAINAKQLEVEFDRGTGIPAITADPGRLQQVVWNLLSNAVKFTPEGGRIRIDLNHSGSGIELKVQDSGAGIPAEFLPHVFERFSQYRSGGEREKGLGLGLAIVRHLCELHGGTVRAISPGAGLGATFIVFLPVHSAIAARADDARESPRKAHIASS